MNFQICTPELAQNYEHLKCECKDKFVLDIGADYGTSAEYYLLHGARYVWAVDAGKEFVERMNRELCVMYPDKVTAQWFFINSPAHFDYVISRPVDLAGKSPEIVKVDIEGFEIHMVGMNDEIFSAPNEYLIEVHSKVIRELITKKLLKNNYRLIDNAFDVVRGVKNVT
jgi:hypothetical protein